MRHADSFNSGNVQISIPIEDNINNGFMVPNRSEVFRKISSLKNFEDILIHSQKILPGVFFCGNTIISPYIKFINTTNDPVFIPNSNFKPNLEPLHNYCLMKFKSKIKNSPERVQQILKELDVCNLPDYSRREFTKLITDYAHIFCLPNEKITTNNFYSQNIVLNDPIPTYVPNYKTIHSQHDEIQSQVRKMLTKK